MNLIPLLTWKLDDDASESLDSRLLPLLAAISTSQSLGAAVAKCGISYRAAWGLLREYQQRLETPLVRLERGRGAALTPAGQALLDANKSAVRRLARIFPRLVVEIAPGPRRKAVASAPRLAIAASYDLALTALGGEAAAEAGLELGIGVVGSLIALNEFIEGRADLAGFHVPLGKHPAWDRTPFLRGLDARRDRLLRFVDRDHGLILARGNPANVRSLRDIAASGLRFVNRQRGSGARLLIDQMLARERIDPADIVGYGREEFTDPAVAATVASGAADAGLGVRAAAYEHRLAFVPLVRERYYLAVRAKELKATGVVRLIRLLKSPTFALIVRRLPGYRIAGAGTVETPAVLAATDPPSP